MEKIHICEFTVMPENVSDRGELTLQGVLSCVQEASGQHSTALGYSWESLWEKGLFWAVLRHRVKIDRLPRLGEAFQVKTWPMPTRSGYPRAVEACDKAGQKLFSAVSLWVLMDKNTRAMVLPGKSGVEVAGHLTGTELAMPKSIPALPAGEERVCTVEAGLTDKNGHMNNIRYLDWVLDALPPALREMPVREFTLCYQAECRLGQQVICTGEVTPEGKFRVGGRREGTDVSGSHHRIFAAEVEF